jgi:hypothetical protein
LPPDTGEAARICHQYRCSTTGCAVRAEVKQTVRRLRMSGVHVGEADGIDIEFRWGI